MSISTVEFLKHIRDEALFLAESTGGITQEKFIDDSVLKRACVRAIEIVGRHPRRSRRNSGRDTPTLNGARWPVCGTD